MAAFALAAMVLGPPAAAAHHHRDHEPLGGNDSCPVCLWQQHAAAELSAQQIISSLVVARLDPIPAASSPSSLPLPRPAARSPPVSRV